ncbi:MAG: hypothetical protein ACK5IC_11580 [Moheibacter sp.]
MKIRIYLLVVIFIILFYIMAFTHFTSNIFNLLIDKNYFIPEESNVFKFKPTKMNEGSGDWWLYGEDNIYYYALNIKDSTPRYHKLKKGFEPKDFDKFNYASWRN